MSPTPNRADAIDLVAVDLASKCLQAGAARAMPALEVLDMLVAVGGIKPSVRLRTSQFLKEHQAQWKGS